MAKLEYIPRLVDSALDQLENAQKRLNGTESKVESAVSQILGARGIEYIDTTGLKNCLGVVDTYSSLITQTIDDINQRVAMITEYNADIDDASFLTRVASTGGLFLSKFAEGLFSAGEQIVDGFASALGFVVGFVSEDAKESIGNFVKKDHVGDFFNNLYDNQLSGMVKYSYAKENGLAANIFKIGGTAVGYSLALYAGGAAVGGISGGAAGATTMAKAAIGSVKASAAIAGVGGLGSGTQAGLQSGLSYDQALWEGFKTGALQAGTVFVANAAMKGVSKAWNSLKHRGNSSTALATTDGVPGGPSGGGSTGGTANGTFQSVDDMAANVMDDMANAPKPDFKITGTKVLKDGTTAYKVQYADGTVDMISSTGRSMTLGRGDVPIQTLNMAKNIFANGGDDMVTGAAAKTATNATSSSASASGGTSTGGATAPKTSNVGSTGGTASGTFQGVDDMAANVMDDVVNVPKPDFKITGSKVIKDGSTVYKVQYADGSVDLISSTGRSMTLGRADVPIETLNIAKSVFANGGDDMVTGATVKATTNATGTVVDDLAANVADDQVNSVALRITDGVDDGIVNVSDDISKTMSGGADDVTKTVADSASKPSTKTPARSLSEMERVSKTLADKQDDLVRAQNELSQFKEAGNGSPQQLKKLEGNVTRAQKAYDTQLDKLRAKQAEYLELVADDPGKIGTTPDYKLINDQDGSLIGSRPSFTDASAKVEGQIDGKALANAIKNDPSLVDPNAHALVPRGETGLVPVDSGNTSLVPVKPVETGLVPVNPGNTGLVPVKSGEVGIMPVKPVVEPQIVPVSSGNTGLVPVNPGNTGLVPVNPGNTGLVPVNPGNTGLVPVNPGNTGLVPVNPGEAGIVPVNPVDPVVPAPKTSIVPIIPFNPSPSPTIPGPIVTIYTPAPVIITPANTIPPTIPPVTVVPTNPVVVPTNPVVVPTNPVVVPTNPVVVPTNPVVVPTDPVVVPTDPVVTSNPEPVIPTPGYIEIPNTSANSGSRFNYAIPGAIGAAVAGIAGTAAAIKKKHTREDGEEEEKE